MRDCFISSVGLSTRLQLDVPLILAQTTLAQIYVEQGRVAEAAEIIAAVQDLVQQRRMGPRWHAAALRGRGLIALARGEWAAAVEHLEGAKAQDERAGIARNLPKIHRLLAEAYSGRGDFAAARVHALAVKRLERGGGPIETPGALRALGMIARERGTLKRAATLLEESRSLMALRRGSGEYARTLVELARTAARMGRREEARRLMEESLAIYRRLEALPLVQVTQQVARELKVKGEGGDGS
jgi:tetratricopeptide (TPR) repeat protein